MLKKYFIKYTLYSENICTTCPVRNGVLHFHVLHFQVLHFHFLQLGPSFTRPAISTLPVKRVMISLTDVYYSPQGTTEETLTRVIVALLSLTSSHGGYNSRQ